MNEENVEWEAQDLRFLSSDQAFQDYLSDRLRQASPTSIDTVDIDTSREPGHLLRLQYDDKHDYKKVATKFGLMPDEKEGIRRMSYRGVIPFAWRGSPILLYTPTWPGGIS